MSLTVRCPSCDRALSLPNDSEAVKARCPTCGTVFDAPAALSPETNDLAALRPTISGLPPPPRPLIAVLVDSSNEAGSDEGEEATERCPRCKRRLPDGWERCSYCDTDLESRAGSDGQWEGSLRRDYEPHRAGLIYLVGAASIFFGVLAALALCSAPFAVAGLVGLGTGGAALLMARDDLGLMDRNIMDPVGRRQTTAGQTNAIVGIIVSLIGILAGGLQALAYFARMF